MKQQLCFVDIFINKRSIQLLRDKMSCHGYNQRSTGVECDHHNRIRVWRGSSEGSDAESVIYFRKSVNKRLWFYFWPPIILNPSDKLSFVLIILSRIFVVSGAVKLSFKALWINEWTWNQSADTNAINVFLKNAMLGTVRDTGHPDNID